MFFSFMNMSLSVLLYRQRLYWNETILTDRRPLRQPAAGAYSDLLIA